MQFLNNISRNKLLIFTANILLCLFIAPYLWYGESIYIRDHDNLDSNLVWLKMVLESGQIFSMNGIVPQIMSGLPISSVYGTIDLNLPIFYCLGIFKGYVFCKFLMMITAFWGMYLLQTRHINKEEKYRWILIATSFLFAITPFWSFSAHVAGIPFCMFALLNFRKNNTAFYNWVILCLFAFWSSLVLTGFFVLLIFACIWLYDIIIKKQWEWSLFVGLFFLSCCYILSHFHYFYMHFFSSEPFVSVRKDFGLWNQVPFLNSLRNSGISIFFNGDKHIARHAVSNHVLMIVPVFLALVLMIRKKELNKLLVILLLYCLLTSLYNGIYEMNWFNSIRIWLMSIIPLNTTRAFWLNAPFWYIIITISFIYIVKRISWGMYFVVFCIIIQAMYAIPQQEYLYYRGDIKYRDFMSEAQFSDIKNTIDKPQNSYKVISLGLHPAISQYNGFYTLDGYSIDYPIEYKKEFRKIIEKELSYNTLYFDNWGARCYLFTDYTNTGYNKWDRNRPMLDRELLFDFDQMKKMGADYLISSYKLNVQKNPHLSFVNEYLSYDYNESGNGAFWDIYLYKIK